MADLRTSFVQKKDDCIEHEMMLSDSAWGLGDGRGVFCDYDIYGGLALHASKRWLIGT